MKKLGLFFPILLISLFFTTNVKAFNDSLIPSIPTNVKSYMISTNDWGVNSGIRYIYLTYCKNDDEVLMPRNTNSQEFAYCYNTNNGNKSYAYRRRFSYNDSSVTWNDIITLNFDFSSYNWGDEVQGNSYGTQLGYYTIDGVSRPLKYYEVDLSQISSFLQTVLSNNENVYQYEDLNTILISKDDQESSSCLDIANQLGTASYVDKFVFNIRGYSSPHSKLKGYIILYSDDFIGVGLSAESFTNISYDLGSDNESEDVNFSYSVSWLNDWGGQNHPAYKISYEAYDDSGGGFDAYTQVIMNVGLSSSNVKQYFEKDVKIFAFTNCRDDSISYGYVNYKTNSNISSDPYLENYLNNMSLPNFKFFNNINTLLPVGPVDGILTIPYQVYDSLTTSLNGTCTTLSIPLPFVNGNLNLPCMNSFYSNIGATNFVNNVGLIASTIILINYFLFLYNWIDSVLHLERISIVEFSNDVYKDERRRQNGEVE